MPSKPGVPSALPITQISSGRTNWSLGDSGFRDGSEAWAEILTSAFMPWSLAARVGGDFRARLRQREFAGYRLSRCACGETGGRRAGAEIARTDRDHYAILYVVSGQESVKIGSRDIVLSPGNLLLWDSGRPMAFEVGGDFKKLTLFAPAEALEAVFPFAQDHVGQVLDGRRGSGALFAQHLKTLERLGWTLDAKELERSMRGTLELFSQAVSAMRSGETRSHKRLVLERVLRYARRHLGDPDLTPTHLAAAHGISVRYLHVLFEQIGETAGAWLRRERLQRCRELLESPAERHRSVTDIALSCGFQDPAHFSRVYRSTFDMTPREARSRAFGEG